MLALARSDNQKTVMGILSLLPGLRELPFLKAEMAWYNDRETRCLYVRQRSNWVQGVLGVEFLDHDIVLVRHVAFTPEARTVENYFELLSNFQTQNPTAFLMGTLDNQKLINKWRRATS